MMDYLHGAIKKYKESGKKLIIATPTSDSTNKEIVTSSKKEETSPLKEKKQTFIIAKSPSDYDYGFSTTEIRYPKYQYEEVIRNVFTYNNIQIVVAKINQRTLSYKIEEVQMNKAEKELFIKYQQYHKIEEAVDFTKGTIKELFDNVLVILKNFIDEQKILLSYMRLEVIAYYVIKTFGYYEITPLLFDDKIEDINGVQGSNVIIHDSEFVDDLTCDTVLNRNEIEKTLKRFSEYGGRTITPQETTVSVTLPEGSRFVCIMPFEQQGSISFSIRKQVFNLISPMMSIDSNFITVDEMAFLAWILSKPELGKVGYVGMPGSGKTSLLKTMALFMPKAARVFTIETTPEIVLRQKSWARNTYAYDSEKQVKLLSAAMMYRPSYLIVGEVKLEKDLVDNLFSAMSSGFKTTFTFHADTTSSFISKLQSRNLDIPKDRITNIKFLVFIVEDVSVKKRYIANIDEIYDYDNDKDLVLWNQVIKTKVIKDTTDTNRYKTLHSLGVHSENINNPLSPELIETFSKLTGLNVNEQDVLGLLLLKSKNIENYVKIFGFGKEEHTEYEQTQLRYAIQYKQYYLEIDRIRSFLSREVKKYQELELKYVKENKPFPPGTDVDMFLNDLNDSYQDLFNE